MTAAILRFPRALGDEVDLAWAAYRAFKRAEMADPSLLSDPAHVKARDIAEEAFERKYAEWCSDGR